MTSRELVIKTLNHEPVPRVPRDLWIPARRGLHPCGGAGGNERSLPQRHRPARGGAAARQANAERSRARPANTPTRGVASGMRPRPERPPELKHSPLGRRRQDRVVPAAGRIARPLPLRQGEQELPGDHAVRAGVVGSPAVRPAAVPSRQRGGAGGSCPRNEGDPRTAGHAPRFRLQGARALGRHGS